MSDDIRQLLEDLRQQLAALRQDMSTTQQLLAHIQGQVSVPSHQRRYMRLIATPYPGYTAGYVGDTGGKEITLGTLVAKRATLGETSGGQGSSPRSMVNFLLGAFLCWCFGVAASDDFLRTDATL